MQLLIHNGFEVSTRIVRVLFALILAFGCLGMNQASVIAADMGLINGTIDDVEGHPIQNVHVFIENYASGEWIAGTNTDENGDYSLGNLAAGVYRLIACPSCSDPVLPYANQYAGGTAIRDDAEQVVVENDATARRDFTLTAGGGVSGMVTNKVLSGLSGICMHVFNQNEQFINGTETDAGGNYSIHGLPVGNYKVMADAQCKGSTLYLNQYFSGVSNFSSATLVPVTSGNTTSGIDMALDMANTIRGTVTDTTTNLPVSGVNMYLLAANHEDFITGTTTAENGSYSFNGLEDGTYTVRAAPEDTIKPYYSLFYNQRSDGGADLIQVSGGQTRFNINFALEPAALLTGKLTNAAGDPLINYPVQVKRTNSYDYYGSWTNNEGIYSLSVPAGNYQVYTDKRQNSAYGYIFTVDQFYNHAANLEEAKLVAAIAGQLTTVNFSLTTGGNITGVIKDSPSGLPLRYAEVMAIATDGSRRSYSSQQTTANGQYVIPGLPAGQYILRATHSGRQARYYGDQASWVDTVSVTVTVGSTTQNININLPIESGEDTSLVTTRIATGLLTPFDPSKADTVQQIYIIKQIFSGMEHINPVNEELTIDLASGCFMNDSTHWTCTLKPGLKWSDGTPLTAADVRFGILHGLYEDIEQAFTFDLFVIKNAEAYNLGEVSADEVGIGLDGIDPEHILHFELEHPVAFFPAMMADIAAYPLPQMLVQAFPDTWLNTDKLITSGPYKLISYDNATLLLKKNENFHNSANVQIEQVVITNTLSNNNNGMKLFWGGKVDMASIADSQVNEVRASGPPNQYKEVNTICTGMLTFNTSVLPNNHRPQNPTLLRKALIEAIDRETLSHTVNNGYPTAWTLIPPGLVGHSDEGAGIHIPYNPDQARTDISLAYGGNYAGLPRIELYYYTGTPGTEMHQKNLNYVANVWNTELQGNFVVIPVSFDEWTQKNKNGQAFSSMIINCSANNEGYGMVSFPKTNNYFFGDWNTTSYNNYKNLLVQALSTTDQSQRAALYRQAEEVVLKTDAVVMPTSYYIRPVLSRGALHNLANNGMDYIADWTLENSNSITIGGDADEISEDGGLNGVASTNAETGDVTFVPEVESGTVRYLIPVNTFPAGTTITHTSKLTNDLTGVPAGMQNLGRYFDFQSSATAVNPFTLSVEYFNVELDTLKLIEPTLALYTWDEGAGQWVKDPESRIDLVNNLITTTTMHEGKWLVMGTQYTSQIFIPLVLRQ
jgi:oligopeptide transport system substrate-binding protein